jgi:prevent-host-death family protein
MTTVISQRELRNDNAAIMRRVEQGERFTVTRHGRPIASVIPVEELPPETRRMTGSEIQALWRELPPVETEGWWAEILAARRAYDEGVPDDVDEDAWAREARKKREREERSGAAPA